MADSIFGRDGWQAARETLAEDARRVKNQTDFDWNMFFLLKVVSKKVIG
jgi:hypothetical protein